MSSVTPSYLADWEKWTVEFPTMRKSGRGIEVEILGVDMISASVLSSFSFSLLWVIHDLTSWTHFCMDWMSSPTCFGGVDFCNWVSSAKKWWRTEQLSITSERGAVYRMKRTGLCGTPQLVGWDRATVVYSYSLSPVCEIRREPVESSITYAKHMFKTLEKNGIVSKAADRSSRVRTDTFPWSRECRRSFITFNRAVSVPRPGL